MFPELLAARLAGKGSIEFVLLGSDQALLEMRLKAFDVRTCRHGASFQGCFAG